MPKTVLTVFLSSTAEDLKSYREAVYERLGPIPFLKCIRMEDFGAPDADGVKACRDGLADADLFVGLTGMRRGWEPNGDAGKRSITEMEHDWAKERRLPRFIHVSPESFPVPGHLFESEDKHNRLKTFRAKIMSERVVSRSGFDTAHLLASAVVENLLTQIIHNPKLMQALHAAGAAGSADLEAAKLLNAADAEGLTKQAENAGVERLAVFELARRINPDQVESFEQAFKELSAAVDIAVDVAKQGRGGNLDSLVRDVLGKVSEKTKAGDFDGAALEADRGFERWEQEEERQQREENERRTRSLASGIAILEAGLEQDLLRRDALGAAKRIEMIVGLTHPDNAAMQFDALRQRQDEFYVRGRDRGINFDLLVSIEIARVTLALVADADQRGSANVDLGIALRTLGERESGRERLEEAFAAYRAALVEYTRKRVPLDWAMTQNNLGNALLTLGKRETGTAQLEEAVVAYRAALLQYTRERVPLDWAAAQNSLGTALKALGDRESGTERLEEVVAAYRSALLEYTRERVPLDWAMTQNNLGDALRTLGARGSGTERLEEAVEACRDALNVFESAQTSHYVEIARRNLARAEALLSERRNGKSD